MSSTVIRTFVYENVPRETFDAMKRASSRGGFFNAHIRDRYAFRRSSATVDA
jgi:hypothetical protein